MSFFPRLPRQFFTLPIFNTQMILEVSFSALQTSKGPRCPSVHGKEGIRGLLIIETGHWLAIPSAHHRYTTGDVYYGSLIFVPCVQRHLALKN